MSVDKHKSLVRTWYEGFTERNVDKFCSVQTDDVMYNVAGRSPFSGQVASLDTVRMALPRLFDLFEPVERPESDTRWTIMCADERRVVGFMAVNWKSQSTGLPYNQTYCQTFEFRNDKICKVWEFFDTVLVHQALMGNELKQPEQPLENPFEFPS